MSVLTTIEDIAENQLTRRFHTIYADLDRANVIADQLAQGTAIDLPVLIILPIPIEDEDAEGGLLLSNANLSLFFLDRHTDDTQDINQRDVQDQLIDPMTAHARRFFHKLMESDIADVERPLPARTYVPTYTSLDAHLGGVFVNVKVPIVEGITGC